jgi:hypothetical protein
MSSGRILAQKCLQVMMADFCHTPTTNLTQHNPHGPDGSPKPLIITIWTWQEMMVWMSMELIGFMDVI